MARTTATNFSGALQFPYATAGTDIFQKGDIQTLALAVDLHDHTAGKGLSTAPADASITNAKLGPDVARANLLTNGGFEIWQRGNGPFTVQNSWGPDRWQVAPQGTDTLSVSRDVTGTDLDIGSTTAAACTFTLGTGAGTSNLAQPLGEVGHLRSRPVSLSVRVKTSTANAVRVSVYNGSAHIYSAFHTGDGTYQTLTVTTTVTAGATLVNLVVWFAVSCTAYIDNAMLVVGSQAANYVPLHPADDLARCLRYYEVFPVNMYVGTGRVIDAVTIRIPIRYVQKATAPTITLPAAATMGVNDVFNPTAATLFTTPTVVSANIGLTSSGLTAGQAAYMQLTSAAISIEANP